jgi:signal peptidase I
VVGRAEIIFFSIDDNATTWHVWEWPWTVRWGRLFNTIR